jgi:hypothetical protein
MQSLKNQILLLLRLKRLIGHLPHPHPTFEPDKVLQMDDSVGNLMDGFLLPGDETLAVKVGIKVNQSDTIEISGTSWVLGWLTFEQQSPLGFALGLSRLLQIGLG